MSHHLQQHLVLVFLSRDISKCAPSVTVSDSWQVLMCCLCTVNTSCSLSSCSSDLIPAPVSERMDSLAIVKAPLLSLSLSLSPSVVAALPGGQSEIKTLTVSVGQNITLPTGVTGLHGNETIIWSISSPGSKSRLLLNSDDENLESDEPQRFHLDRQTGSLTILSVSINESGRIEGQVLNGNGPFLFNLTVVGE